MVDSQSHAQPRQAGYETRDVNPRALIKVAAAIFIGVALVLALIAWGLQGRPGTEALPDNNRFFPLPLQPAGGPMLQAAPQADLARMMSLSRANLDSFGWIDEEEDRVHIPIEQAMALYLQRLYLQQQNAADPAIPGDTSP